MATRRGYLVPQRQAPTEQGYKHFQRAVQDALPNIMQGRLNCAGDLTLTAGTTTTLTDAILHTCSVIILMPKSAAAAALQSSIYITPAQGSATLTHSTAAGGEAFSWVALG